MLSGDFNPCGKLTMTFPRNLGQVPIHYDAKNTGRPYTPGQGEQHYVSRYLNEPTATPLYPFGYGLSYTTFEYSDLKVAPEKDRHETARSRNRYGQEHRQGTRHGGRTGSTCATW